MPTQAKIFKAYDIRGVYPSEMDEESAYKIGVAYANLLQSENPDKKLKIVVGKDMRLSGESLEKELIRGLTDAGVDVVKIGLASTPTFYFAVAYNNFDGGIEVSASHNPGEYNGFKMVRAHGVPVSGNTGIENIKNAVMNNDLKLSEDKGNIEELADMTTKAVEIESQGITKDKIKPFKIVIDAANAMGIIDLEEIFKDLPCEIVKLNWELDGSFPAHEADPLKEENLKQLQEAVVNEGADLGIGPDGDFDRIFFVDDSGRTMPQALLRGLMAQIALSENPGATVCYDIRPGRITKDLIEEAGGKASVTRVGHSLIKEQMLKEDAVFGGESSGHYFYKFNFGTFEAPTTLILKFLVYLSSQEQKLSELVKSHDKYHHSGEINSMVEDKEGKIKELGEKYSDGEISYLDGITVTYKDWWFNVRPSNTESKLRLNLEATSAKIMEEKRDEVLAIIRREDK